MKNIHLGVNIDHVATLRNARGENDPNIIEMASEVTDGGADSLTMHLREDRRHVLDEDVFAIKKQMKVPLNFEMAVTEEMINIAAKLKPASVCLVPEKREEKTTEGGINLEVHFERLKKAIPFLQEQQIEVYCFIEPTPNDIALSAELKANGVEIHTGAYARAFTNRYQRQIEWEKIVAAAKLSDRHGLEFHAGHGLNYFNIAPFLKLENLTEVNIGHALIARSLKSGLKTATEEMKLLLKR